MTVPAVVQLELGPMENNVYLLGREKACVVIDPGWEGARILTEASARGMEIQAVVLTHGHFDHIGAVQEVAEEADVPVFVNEHEKPVLGGKTFGDRVRWTRDNEILRPADLEILCLHTPGHSPGGQCLLCEGLLFTGDTLFLDHCGRVDLPGGNAEAMFGSMRRLAQLPPETLVYPGHRYHKLKTDTIGRQKKTNPFLQAQTAEEFLDLV